MTILEAPTAGLARSQVPSAAEVNGSDRPPRAYGYGWQLGYLAAALPRWLKRVVWRREPRVCDLSLAEWDVLHARPR